MIRITHIITGLEPDGAETMLYSLVRSLRPDGFRNQVISLTSLGVVGPRLQAAGLEVRALGMRGSLDARLLPRLSAWLKEARPDVIHTWMYHANLLGGLAALGRGVPLVWSIHHSRLDRQQDKRTTRWVSRGSAWLSRALPASIVCCSESARREHAGRGYCASKLEVIPNGVDPEAFRPDPNARGWLRDQLGLPIQSVLIGMAARFHPAKDFATFVNAAGRVAERFPGVHFVMCGRNVDGRNPELRRLVAASRAEGRFHLLGDRPDMPRLLAGLDLLTCASHTEAFPLVLGEAMACGTPCVASDVGDCAAMLGETGRVVPPADPNALAAVWEELIITGSAGRRALGAAARRRLLREYSLPAVTQRYEALYSRLARGVPVNGQYERAAAMPV